MLDIPSILHSSVLKLNKIVCPTSPVDALERARLIEVGNIHFYIYDSLCLDNF